MKKISLWTKLIGRRKPRPDEPAKPQPVVEGERSSAVPASHATKTKLDPNPPLPGGSGQSSTTAKQVNGKERVVRVFVSSTFRDMVEDRNALMAHVWPALRKLCRERAVEFVEVDLRWGITESMSQRQETVRHCLAEIKRCRPYFIGLLGERYGWTPGPEAYPEALLHEEPWLQSEIAKHSVTELEILHGVLNDPDMAGRAFFYFRDPAYVDRFKCKKRWSLLEYEHKEVKQHGKKEAMRLVGERRAKLAALKDEIRKVCSEKQIPLHEGDEYRDPQTLAGLVIADLASAINAQFPEDQVPDVWAREARDHQAYANSRITRFYVGRDSYFAQLDAYAQDGDDGKGRVVLGESGGGKSALLANWASRWGNAHTGDFLFQHYIGGTAAGSGHLFLMRRLMVAVIRWCGEDAIGLGGGMGGGMGGFGSEEEKIPARAEEIVKVFPDYLGRLAYRANKLGVRAIIVLDALNQLEDYEKGRLLGWLPYRMSGNIRLIVSTLPGDTLEALQPRQWPSLTVEPLTRPERTELIARYLENFSQALSEQRARRIAALPATANPLYVKTLLDDLRVTGAHDQLDQQLDDYLKAQDLPSLFGKILGRYEKDYQRDRLGLVKDAVSLLWGARRGLTEPELLELLKSQGQDRLPAAYWTPLRYAIADGLVDRDGMLAFTHEHLRLAVERKYLPVQDAQDELRLTLTDYFEAQPISARNCDELPWLLAQTKSYERLKACLLDIDRFILIQKRDQNELMRYWVDMGSERTMGQAYLDSFAHWENKAGQETTKDQMAIIAMALGYFLIYSGLYAAADSLFRRALVGLEKAFGANDPITLISEGSLARLLRDQGKYAAAEPLFRRVVVGLEKTLGPNDPTTLTCICDLAELLFYQGDYTAAESFFRRALAGQEKALGPEHPHTLTSVGDLAELLRAQGDYTAAESFSRRALVGQEKALGPEHPHTLTSVNNLALLLQDLCNYAGADTLHRRALAGREQALGPNHPDTLNSVNNLAVLLKDQGNYAAAEPLYRRALAGYEQALGSNHPKTLSSVSNLARLLDSKGDYVAAESLYRRALAGCEQALWPDHPDTLNSVSNLASFLRRQGDYGAAEPFCRRALAGCEQALGPDHPSTLSSDDSLARLLQDQGDYAAAEPLYRRALARREQTLGLNHLDTLNNVNSLASLLQAQGDYAAAEPLYRRALAGCEQALGPNHPHTLASANNLATLLHEQGKLADAEPLYRRALAGREQALGPYHSSTLISVGSLARLLQDQGDNTAAEPLYRRALEGHEKVLGLNNPDTLTSVNNLASLLRDQGDYAAAEPLYRRAVAGCEQVLGSEHPETLTSVNNLAALLYDEGDYNTAERLFHRVLAGYEKALGPNHPNTLSSVSNLAALLDSQGDYIAAEPLYRRALAGYEKVLGPNHPRTLTCTHNLNVLLEKSSL